MEAASRSRWDTLLIHRYAAPHLELMDLYLPTEQGRPSVMCVPLRRAAPDQGAGTEAPQPAGEDGK